LVGTCDEIFETHDADIVGVGEIPPEPVTDVELAKTPASPAEHKIGSLVRTGANRFRETNHFEWDFLLRRPRHLLPFQRDDPLAATSLREDVCLVSPPSGSHTDADLDPAPIATVIQGGDDHLLKH
jgi:hypothetical protein